MNKLDEIRQRLDATSADLRDLLAVAEAAEAVDREWRERGDGGCIADVRLSLSAALARLHTAEVTA